MGFNTETYHAGLGNRICEQDQEETQHRSDPDGEAAGLALRAERRQVGGEEQRESVNEAPVYLPPQHFGHIISQEWK